MLKMKTTKVATTSARAVFHSIFEMGAYFKVSTAAPSAIR